MELVLRVLGRGVREEVARAVLDALVDRQQQQRSLAGAELEEQAVQAGALARREGGEEGLLLGCGADFHGCLSTPYGSVIAVWTGG